MTASRSARSKTIRIGPTRGSPALALLLGFSIVRLEQLNGVPTSEHISFPSVPAFETLRPVPPFSSQPTRVRDRQLWIGHSIRPFICGRCNIQGHYFPYDRQERLACFKSQRCLLVVLQSPVLTCWLIR